MKILIDTNVILDVLCDRKEFVKDSSLIWKYCELNRVEGYISALTILNIVYILRKELTPEKTRQVIQQITMIFQVVDLKSSDLKNAADMLTSDYEDAIQMCQANRIGAEFIVTRNIKDYADSAVSVLTPSEFVKGQIL